MRITNSRITSILNILVKKWGVSVICLGHTISLPKVILIRINVIKGIPLEQFP